MKISKVGNAPRSEREKRNKMESNSEASCISDPNFAVICAFLERFAKSCGIAHPPFLDLQEMLENVDEVPQELVDLHIILLRKARRSVFREKWEKALVKFCQIYSTQDGWEIERFGYKNSRLEVKLRVLKNLLEGQFDLNCKFKSIINTHESSELRSKPVGKDKSGRIYWLQIDPVSNIRVYREDLDEESWSLVAKDRETLVQLLQELSANEESLDVNLLNEDSSISVDIDKTILDTGQECGISDAVTNGDAQTDEKDPLEIKTSDNMMNDVEYGECHNDIVPSDGKRLAEDLFQNRDLKKVKLDDSANDVELGEAVEEPVMHIYGEGNGAECDAGNPDKEDHKTNEGNSSNTSEQLETGQTNSELKKLDLETKPQPKLWSIDTICGTGSFNHSGESSKSAKSVQKNFSTFSIESVLEKKSDSNHSSSPVPESPVISGNAIATIDPGLASINQTNEQTVSVADFSVEGSQSISCTANAEAVSLPVEEKSVNCDNETDSVPDFENRKTDEDSTVRAENCIKEKEKEKETEPADRIRDGDLEVKSEDDALVNRENPDVTTTSNTDSLEPSEKDVCLESGMEEGETNRVHDSLESKQVSDVEESRSEPVKSADGNEVKGEISVSEPERVEENPVENDKTESETKKIEDPIKEACLDQNQSEETDGQPEGEKEEKCEELHLTGETEAAVAEEREKEVAKTDSQILPDEKSESVEETKLVKQEENSKVVEEVYGSGVEDGAEGMHVPKEEDCPKEFHATEVEDVPKEAHFTEATVASEEAHAAGAEDGSKEEQVAEAEEEEGSKEVQLAEEEKQPEKESGIEEDLFVKREISEGTEERLEEEKPDETAPKAEEDVEKISDGVTENKALPEPETVSADEEVIQDDGPREMHVKEEPAEEVKKEAEERQIYDGVDELHAPENAPTVVEDAHDAVLESTERCKEENNDDECPSKDSTPVEKVESEDVLEKQISQEAETETEKPDKIEENKVKDQVPEISSQDPNEPSKECEQVTASEVIESEELIKTEQPCPDDLPSEVEQKAVEEENTEKCEQILPQGEDLDKVEESAKDEVKDEPADEIADRIDDNEVSKEEGEVKTQPAKIGRKRKRSRKQSTDGVPARATRSATKSIDEDTNILQEPPVKKETRKRKSQDSDNQDMEKVSESAQGDEATAAEAEENTTQKRRNSTVNSMSDEGSTATQEEAGKVGGKRMKMRNKKSTDSRARKSTEEKEETSEDENKTVAEGETAPTEEEKKKRGPKAKAKDGTPRTRQLIPERELKLLGLSNMEELPTVRQSRRIAQLKLKEEAERKKLEEAAKEEAKKEKKKKKKKKKLSKPSSKKRKTAAAAGEESYEEADDDDDDDDDEDDEEAVVKQKERKRKKKKDKLVFNELNPWISSSGSSSADEEDEEIEDEAHEEEEILFKSDHEFSPESDIEDPDYKPIKRARTAKVDPKDATEADSKYDDTACEKCGEKDHPEWILLCDTCDKGWHASCVRPALMVVPEGDWFCPPCEHTSLIQKLRESLVEYDRCQKQRENEELRRKRLAFVGISLDNVLPSKKEKKPKPVEDNGGESEETASENGGEEDSSSSGSSSSGSSSSDESSEPVYQLRERRSNVTSYRYNEYDELIKSALQEEMDAAKGVGLGKGKDITNQAEEYEAAAEEAAEEGAVQERNDLISVNIEAEAKDINPQIPRDIIEAKPRLKPKKEGDEDYEVGSDAEEDEEYNEGENGEPEEEDEELGDELPPVVPQYDKKKKKSRSLNVKGLDFTSDEEEEDNSDSDFKGESSEEESEYSLPSESESSDGIRKKHKNFDGPLRRSTRARTARYDKEFINDDSEDEAPRKKKSRNVWVESESSDSDRSWGKRKKRNARSGNRSAMTKKKTKTKGKKKKSKKKSGDSDYEEKSKKSRNRKIKYGGLDELDEEQVLVRRTRGKKINYQEMNASDSEDEVLKRRPRVIGDSDEEFVAEKEKSYDSDGEDDAGAPKSEANGKAVSKKSILRKIKKKRPKVIPDPDDFSEDDLLEDEELDEFAEELEDLDEEEEDMLQEMLNDGDVPIRELKEALGKLKERRREKTDDGKPYPPIPEHMENPGLTPRFPRIGKVKVNPSRSELATQLALPVEPVVRGMRPNPGVLLGNLPKESDRPENVRKEQQGNAVIIKEGKTDSKEKLMNLQPPPYPFPAEGPPGVPALVNAHPFPLNSRPPAPPYNSFQGMIPTHTRLPPEYPHPNIPTTVLGIESEALQDIRKQGQKSSSSGSKRKNEDGLSPQADSGEENSGDGRTADSVDSPKRRGRGRGKKQLLAETQAKQELGISTVQAPTQFPPRGPVPEGAATGSVITRMLNTPQGPQPFPPDFSRSRPFRPPYPNALRPPLNPPSSSPLRAASALPAPPTLPLFHVTLPLDIPPSSIGLPQGKPSQLPPGFPARAPVLPRYPSDPNIRAPFSSHASRGENYPYPNFYPGPFPPPMPNNEEANFHNPNFPNHPFDEHAIPGAAGAVKPPYEEEVGGEFGGLASYFASQREDDLDT